MVVVESMAAGTPALAYARGAMPELIKDGETGYLLGTEDEMIDALRTVERLDRKRCCEWVKQNFSVERMVDGYERLYKEAVGRGKRVSLSLTPY